MTRLSRYKLSPPLKEVYIKNFYKALFTPDSFDDIENFSNHLFTLGEIETFAKRIAVFKFLRRGLSYSEIKDKVKVTTATITKMVNILQKANQNFLRVLDTLIKEEEDQKKRSSESEYIKGSKQLYPRKIK